MVCTLCGGRLMPMNLLVDQPGRRRHLSGARLIGFSDSNGHCCEDVLNCASTFIVKGGKPLLLIDTTREGPHPDADDGQTWQIVVSWELLEASGGGDDYDEEEDD